MRIRIRGYKTLVLSQLLSPTAPSAEAKPYSANWKVFYFFGGLHFAMSGGGGISIIISDPAVKFTILTYPMKKKIQLFYYTPGMYSFQIFPNLLALISVQGLEPEPEISAR
jgi:hypothetical protein